MVFIYLYNDFPHYQHSTDFVFFRDYLNSQDNVNLTSNLDLADILVFFDYIKVRKINQIIKNNQNKFKVLIRTEPISVVKSQYIDNIPFNLVIDLGKSNTFKNKTIFVEWPIANEYFQTNSEVTNNIFNKFAFVNSNKFGNLNKYYFLRRLVVYRLNHLVETYGSGWSITDFKWRNYLGNLKTVFYSCNFNELKFFKIFLSDLFIKKNKKIDLSKRDLLKNFRYVLVIENSDSYISEKLIEALLLNKIVVYVGKPLDDVPVLKKFFLFEVPPNLDLIESTMQNILSNINSNKFFENSSIKMELSEWQSYRVWQKILDIILKHYADNSNS